MIVLQTIGSVDLPGKGPHLMPAPKQYLAIIAGWSVLDIFDDMGYGKAASAMGWLMVAAGMLVGPFGKRVVNVMNTINQDYAISSQQQSGTGTSFTPSTQQTSEA